MEAGGTRSLRLQWCVAACLVAALASPYSFAAEGSAPQGSAPEKEPPTATGPANPSSQENEIRSVREQIAKAPDDVLLYVRLGYLLLNAGAPAEAKTAFDEALKRNEHSHAALTGEGIVLARAGNLKEAEQVLKAALVRNPDPVRTLYELGLVYEKAGDPEKALAEYKEGIAKYQLGRK
jgi:tetratricopeptide (TPR) repeat protein